MAENKRKIVEKKKRDSVGYKGQVEVGIIRNGKKYKKIVQNAGTINLFRYLCRCLAAKFNPLIDVNIAERPGGLKLMNSTSTVLAYGINFDNVEIRENNSSDPSCSVIFSFLVPGTSILKKRINGAQLCSLDGNILYATAEFKNDDGTSASFEIQDIDTNVYITWTLTISNMTI